MTSEEAAAALAPDVPLGVELPLEPRSLTVERIAGVASAIGRSLLTLGGVLLFLAAAESVVEDMMPRVPVRPLLFGLWGVLTLFWLGKAIFWTAIRHRHATYRLDEQKIEMRRGVLNRSVVSVPRSRVQHTDVSQGPLERRFGLGTLVIHTAGTRFAKVRQHGMTYETALHIRDHLLPGEGGDAV